MTESELMTGMDLAPLEELDPSLQEGFHIVYEREVSTLLLSCVDIDLNI